MRQLSTQHGSQRIVIRIKHNDTAELNKQTTATLISTEMIADDSVLNMIGSSRTIVLDRDDMLAIVDLFAHAIYETEPQI